MMNDHTLLSALEPNMDNIKVKVLCVSKWFSHPYGKPTPVKSL